MFKEGQKVLILSGKFTGTKGTVVDICVDEGVSYLVKLPNTNTGYWKYESQLLEVPEKPTFQEGQEVWVAFKDSSNKYKATVIATGEHFTCVHSWVGIPSMEKIDIVENERVFVLDYAKVKTIKINDTVQASCGHIGKVIGYYWFDTTPDSGIRVRTASGFEFGCWKNDFKVLKTIRIGAFEVPEPLTEVPADGCIFFVTIGLPVKPVQFLTQEELQYLVDMRIAHRTKEAADLHEKALLSFIRT
jgi:hypothetical protein